jgi:hypothetical protein
MSHAEHQRQDDEAAVSRYKEELKSALNAIDPELKIVYYPVYGKYLVWKKYQPVFGFDKWFNTWVQGALATIEELSK